uniref:Tyrosine specific protein phosphatases domain-containing protein n=1 Tax=Scleropages formosus TaxID=113540 RepID=A0A8C9TMG0_SCLFO
MVWENRSDVIAMVTQEVERGRVKCHKYWPEKLHEPIDVGCYQLILDNSNQRVGFHLLNGNNFLLQSGDTHVGPVTVHCSAGIGRAGVLICTDIILTLIEKDLSVRYPSVTHSGAVCIHTPLLPTPVFLGV